MGRGVEVRVNYMKQNKIGFCIYYNGIHYDAFLPFQDNPQQFVPHCDLINMSL